MISKTRNLVMKLSRISEAKHYHDLTEPQEHAQNLGRN